MELTLDTIVTSKMRIRIMFKFFLNDKVRSYLRGLEKEFGESTNTIRLELNRFEKAGLLNSEIIQNKKYYKANVDHPFYLDINNILKKCIGINIILEQLEDIKEELDALWITGDIAKGLNAEIVDLVIIGERVDIEKLVTHVGAIQKQMTRRIRFIVLTEGQMSNYFNNKPAFCIWKKNIRKVVL